MSNKNTKDSAFYLPHLPIVQDNTAPEAIAYGVESLTMPISKTENVTIDRAFLAGKSTLRLRNIKQCLTAAGRDIESKEDRTWFNKTVRDGWHKALKYANKTAMSNGTAVSIGLSVRTSKSKREMGKQTLTSRFAYETVIVEGTDTTKQVEDKKQDKPASKPAKRNKRNKRGLVSVGNAIVNAKETLTVKPEATADVLTANVETVSPVS